jgi:DNA-binding NarL/FixJ family response regulator
MKESHPDRVLVIDEIPLIAAGLREVFRLLNPSVEVEYTESIYTALSSKSLHGRSFDLVILGVQASGFQSSLSQPASELKEQFGGRIMIYTDQYDPIVIEKMMATGINAYVHKYESVEEIQKAYAYLSKGETYISEIFHTLYYEYGQGVRK